METVFSRIVAGDLPAVKLHEDDLCIVILDINPVKKGHSLVISKKPYPTVSQCPDDVLSHLMAVAKKLDAKLRKALVCDGTNILINNGPAAGQEVPHLHIHVIPRYEGDGQKFGFVKESYAEGEMVSYGKKLLF
ncbi:MAG: HIT family protein [Sphaerochaetaceae bacterium]